MARDQGWRLEVRLRSAEALCDYMKLRGVKSSYDLARRAGLGYGIVGHLTAGRRVTCKPSTARAIEEALSCPPDVLFVAEMSQVAGDGRRAA